MEKFTKGPWIRKYHANGCNYVSAQDVSLNGCYSVASCVGPDEISNAHLIAAAPEMYELLDDYVSFVERGDAEGFNQMFCVVKELLAKARGEL